MFNKILIANRGEIALRIIRACKELQIRTVAVYSEADRDSLHVRFADEDVCIGPAESVNSYLNIPSIISAAEITDADAIHPGYGFLSEDPHFAEVCESCKISFIGPGSDIIRLMGDKISARRLISSAGVPVLPGSGKINNPEEGQKTANKIGYPVIIKSAGGGGGKGMRVVHSDASFTNAFMMAKAEAGASGNEIDLYVEKFLLAPKHIEIQILADKQGNVVYLGERECSVQRRYQKILEESPSTAIDDNLRTKMGQAAVKVTRKAGYASVGTVEFLVDKNHDFYIIEVNTRVQVEHPVTEMVTDVDIIKEQIRIAAGEPLSLTQAEVKSDGHAIECRINAEDPENLLPCPGTIEALHIPGGPNIRFDTAAYAGGRILPYYDSLIGKLVVKGKNRPEAIEKMKAALNECTIEGIKTLIPLHRKLLRHSTFVNGRYSTKFLDNFLISSKY
ncbi:MAG: acetyl-CoA carboxylase biotin carboxylase subunit [bacterium]